MRAALALFCIISFLLVTFTHTPVLVAAATASCTTKCTPWRTSPACQRGKGLDLRFMLGLSPANYWKDAKSTQQNYTVYAFCPNVDNLQAFTLNAAGLLTAGGVDSAGTPYIYTPVQSTNLSVYGFGSSDSRRTPLPNTNGTVLVAEDGYKVCGTANQVLVASILLLEIGLHKGTFNYLPSTMDRYQWENNTNYNATLCKYCSNTTDTTTTTTTTAPDSTSDGINVTELCNATDKTIDYCSTSLWRTNGTYLIPAKTGFKPTCTVNKEGKDICSFNSSAQCIGAVSGAKNCAQCYSSAVDLANANIQVWTSYFGSDSKSVTLLSGGTNPMTYYKFAGGDIFSNIANQLDSVSKIVSNESGKINTSWWKNFSW